MSASLAQTTDLQEVYQRVLQRARVHLLAQFERIAQDERTRAFHRLHPLSLDEREVLARLSDRLVHALVEDLLARAEALLLAEDFRMQSAAERVLVYLCEGDVDEGE